MMLPTYMYFMVYAGRTSNYFLFCSVAISDLALILLQVILMKNFATIYTLYIGFHQFHYKNASVKDEILYSY